MPGVLQSRGAWGSWGPVGSGPAGLQGLYFRQAGRCKYPSEVHRPIDLGHNARQNQPSLQSTCSKAVLHRRFFRAGHCTHTALEVDAAQHGAAAVLRCKGSAGDRGAKAAAARCQRPVWEVWWQVRLRAAAVYSSWTCMLSSTDCTSAVRGCLSCYAAELKLG